MKITELDRQTAVWQKIEAHLKDQIESTRLELEKVTRDHKGPSDDVLKGKILAYRRLLAKADENGDVRATTQKT